VGAHGDTRGGGVARRPAARPSDRSCLASAGRRAVEGGSAPGMLRRTGAKDSMPASLDAADRE